MSANKFTSQTTVSAWAAVRGEVRVIERKQLMGERPEIELKTIPLIDTYDEDPDSPTYRQIVKRSGGCWIASCEDHQGRPGIAVRASIQNAALRIVEGSHALATAEQIQASLDQEVARTGFYAAEDLKNTQGKRPVIVSLPKEV